MAVYGHRHSDRDFLPLLEFGPAGILCRGREYAWKDVARVEETPGSWVMDLTSYPAGQPRATIHFSDGTCARIHGRMLERDGQPSPIDPRTGATMAFAELLAAFGTEVAADRSSTR